MLLSKNCTASGEAGAGNVVEARGGLRIKGKDDAITAYVLLALP